MKKTVSILAAAVLAFVLVACDSQKSTTLSDVNIELSDGIVSATDAFLTGGMEAEEAGDEVYALYEKIDKSDGMGYASVDRASLQENAKKLAEELQDGGEDLEMIVRYRNKIAGLAKLDVSSASMPEG